jgi:hypothetical protein
MWEETRVWVTYVEALILTFSQREKEQNNAGQSLFPNLITEQ